MVSRQTQEKTWIAFLEMQLMDSQVHTHCQLICPELDWREKCHSFIIRKKNSCWALATSFTFHLCICGSSQLRQFELSQTRPRWQFIFRYASHVCGQQIPTTHSSHGSSKSRKISPNTSALFKLAPWSTTLWCPGGQSKSHLSNIRSRDRKWTWWGQGKALDPTVCDEMSKSIQLLLQNNTSWLAYAQ